MRIKKKKDDTWCQRNTTTSLSLSLSLVSPPLSLSLFVTHFSLFILNFITEIIFILYIKIWRKKKCFWNPLNEVYQTSTILKVIFFMEKNISFWCSLLFFYFCTVTLKCYNFYYICLLFYKIYIFKNLLDEIYPKTPILNIKN